MGNDAKSEPSFSTAGHDGSQLPPPPQIKSFTAQGAVAVGVAQSLQVEEGASIDVTWQIDGDVTALYIDGTEFVEGPAGAKGKAAHPKLDPAAGTAKIAVTAKAGQVVTYTMRAQSVHKVDKDTSFTLENASELIVSVNEPGQAVAPAASVKPPLHLGAVAVSSNGDIYMDPPVRIITQYGRVGGLQIAGQGGVKKPVTWVGSGCGPTSCAMILRWFAEDCAAGRVKFPAKQPKPAVQKDLYPLVMADCFWPRPLTPPNGKIGLTAGQKIDNLALWGMAAHWLKSNGDYDNAARSAYFLARRPTISDLTDMLTTGPVILGIGDPAPEGHFVVVQGYVGGALLIVDPGAVIAQAMRGGKNADSADGKKGGGATLITDWSHLKGKDYLEGSVKANRDKARVPDNARWPDGKAPEDEDTEKGSSVSQCYCAVSGAVLKRLMDHALNATSLTYPEGAALTPLAGVAPPAQSSAYVKTTDPSAPFVPDEAPPAAAAN